MSIGDWFDWKEIRIYVSFRRILLFILLDNKCSISYYIPTEWQTWVLYKMQISLTFLFVFICHSGRVSYDFFSSWFYFKKFSSVIDSCGLINLGNFVKANNFQKLFSDSFFDCVSWSSFVMMISFREFCGFSIRVYLSLWKSLLWFLFKLILF